MKYEFIILGTHYTCESKRRRNGMIVLREIIKDKNLPANGDFEFRVNDEDFKKFYYAGWGYNVVDISRKIYVSFI